ncbi:molybdate ABC transporter substrate-binding protein [Geomicrobium sp. JCM 19055]|uniref:molybdate ABC transporter substrate-binding protein n=1 Tax=Geomicrobium sp. JCM 19055 TaxID=1460649 RepID=UPI00045ECF5C|nr:molybdate ABC transporter substrate-binding protein [Geomicrobium sp. JCM 19055]GAJ99620.1 molybdenum ABC transporter, periplasmic molybdenum-binding protein ModA [Geomicrobium sp. JCM 19055]
MENWFNKCNILLTGCEEASDVDEENPEIFIMAAASMTDAVNDLQDLYKESHDVEFVVNYGSSGQLRQQIVQGAPADLFLSASLGDVERLEEEIDIRASVELVENQLTLISTPGVEAQLDDWSSLADAELQNIAIGQPDTVPAGQYTMEALENEGLWSAVEPSAVYGSDVRQVLTYVETGNADAGFVYHTDALTSEDVVIIDHAPEGSHSPIVYPIAQLTDEEAAQDFF